MIAPPHYRCETVTLEKQKGIQKLEEALKVVEKVIKQKQGTYKLVNKPQVIGAKDDKDIEDIMAKMNEESGDEAAGGSSKEEDNEEGMDIELDEDAQEEEKQNLEKKKKSKKAKGKEEEDEEDDDQWDRYDVNWKVNTIKRLKIIDIAIYNKLYKSSHNLLC